MDDMTIDPNAVRKRKPDTNCGTYGGYQAHRRRGEVPCGPCRQANAAYSREFRSRRADVAAENRRRVNANSRAVWRLIDRYRDEWRLLVLEELDKP